MILTCRSPAQPFYRRRYRNDHSCVAFLGSTRWRAAFHGRPEREAQSGGSVGGCELRQRRKNKTRQLVQTQLRRREVRRASAGNYGSDKAADDRNDGHQGDRDDGVVIEAGSGDHVASP